MKKEQRWAGAEAKAARALAANKRRIESASSAGTASEHTLSQRSYSVSPEGGMHAPAQKLSKQRRRRKKKRRTVM